MDFSKYTFEVGEHRDKKVILIHFEYQASLKNELKQRFPSAKWSQTRKAWYLPNLPVIRKFLNLKDTSANAKKLVGIAISNSRAYQQMEDQLTLKAYSSNTKRMYLGEFAHLLRLLKEYPVTQLTADRLKDYFLYCVQKEKMR